MSTYVKKLDVHTDDLGFAAFVECYQSCAPWRCTTDHQGKPKFHFKVSSLENFDSWKQDYESDQGCVGIKSFMDTVRILEHMAKATHEKGGILTVWGKAAVEQQERLYQ